MTGKARALGFALLVLTLVSGPQKPAPKPSGGAGELPLFLDEFRAGKEAAIVTKDIAFPSAIGRVHASWSRPETKERLPAVLLVYDDKQWSSWMNENSRHLAGIGYGVLTVAVQPRRLVSDKLDPPMPFTDEATLAELSAAVRWLRGRPDVLPDHIGVVGWTWGGGQALALAAATSLQACVCCDSPIPNDPSLILGLRRTPLLGVFASDEKAAQKDLPAFRKDLSAAEVPNKFHLARDVPAGFMGPPDRKTYRHQAAEEAWVEIYEFLGKHVEDARPQASTAGLLASGKPVATIADLMLAVNAPTGLRGTLSQALEQEPGNPQQWNRVRAAAAVIAEGGGWLQQRKPPKGSATHWKEQAQAFTANAQAIVTAADRHDYAGARKGLQGLAMQCAACHSQHR